MLVIPDTRLQRGALGRDLSAWFHVEPGPNLLNVGNGVTSGGTAYQARAAINSGYPGHVDEEGWWDQSKDTSWANLGGSDSYTYPSATFGALVEVLDTGSTTQNFLLRGADFGSGGYGWGFQLARAGSTGRLSAFVVTSPSGGNTGAAAFTAADPRVRPPGSRAFVVGRYTYATGDIDLFVDGRLVASDNSPTYQRVRDGRDGNGGGWTTGVNQLGTPVPAKVRLLFVHEAALESCQIEALAERVLWRPTLFYFPTLSSGATGTAAQTTPAAEQSATGVMQPEGTAAQAAPAATQTASGVETHEGTAAQTLAAATQSAAGTGSDTISGAAAQTAAATTQSASGLMQPEGTAAQTAPAATQTAAGAQAFTGTAAQTAPAATQAAAGTHGDVVTGTAAQALPAATQSAAGAETLTGTAAQTLAAATQSASGSGGDVVEPEVEVPGVGAGGGGEPYRTGGISGSAFISSRDEPGRVALEAVPEPARERGRREPGPGLDSLLPRDQSLAQARADRRRELDAGRREAAEAARLEAEAANERLIAWLEASLAEAQALAADDAEVLQVYQLYRKRRVEMVLRYLSATGRLTEAA